MFTAVLTYPTKLAAKCAIWPESGAAAASPVGKVMTRFLRFKLTKASHLSPNDRFLIGSHSPDGITETGLPVRLPEKKAPELCLQRLEDTFSSPV